MASRKSGHIFVTFGFVLFASLVSAGFYDLDVQDHGTKVSVDNGNFSIDLIKEPFQMKILDKDSNVILESDPDDFQLSLAKGFSWDLQKHIYEGYSFRLAYDYSHYPTTKIGSFEVNPNKKMVKFDILTDHLGGVVELTLANFKGTYFDLSLKAAIGNPLQANRISWGFLSPPEEGFFGFGERFMPAQNKRGEKLYNWVEDGGFSFGLDVRLPKGPSSTYIPIPFLLSSRGYGLHLDTTWRTEFDLVSGIHPAYSFKVETDELNMAFFLGETPAQSVGMYTDMVGRPLIPPKFQFGPWVQFGSALHNVNATDWPHDTGVSAWRQFIEWDIPNSVAVYSDHFFPMGVGDDDAEKIRNKCKAFEETGQVYTAYFNSMIDTRYTDAYKHLSDNDMFVKNPDGTDYQFSYKGAGTNPFFCAVMDFTNPDTVTWYQGEMQKAVDLGIKGWMYDYGEYIDPANVFHNGMTGDQMHNDYPNIYHKAAYDFFVSKDTEKVADGYAPDYMFYVRSGYSGSQSNTWSVWTGDPSCDWTDYAGLPAQLSAMLSAGISGFPYIGSDIAGFVEFIVPPSEELWIRWAQVGMLSGTLHTQDGGTNILGPDKQHICEWTEGRYVWRKLAKLRTALFPYLYNAAHQNAATGLPIMRQHILTFPEDQEAWSQNYQFMFGDSFLAAPVVKDGQRTQSVYLPKGTEWYDFTSVVYYDQLDGRYIIQYSTLFSSEGQYEEVRAELDMVPMFVRAGSIVPSIDSTVDTLNDAQDPSVVSIYELDYLLHLWTWLDSSYNASVTMYDGASFTVSKQSGDDTESTLVWKSTDPLKRIHVVQMVITPAPASITVRCQDSKVSKGSSWEELAVLDHDEQGTNEWVYYYNARVLWLRYTGSMDNEDATLLIDVTGTQ